MGFLTQDPACSVDTPTPDPDPNPDPQPPVDPVVTPTSQAISTTDSFFNSDDVGSASNNFEKNWIGMVLMVVCALVALGIHLLLCYCRRPSGSGRSGNGRAMVLPEQPGLNFNDRQESQIELQKTPGAGN